MAKKEDDPKRLFDNIRKDLNALGIRNGGKSTNHGPSRQLLPLFVIFVWLELVLEEKRISIAEKGVYEWTKKMKEKNALEIRVDKTKYEPSKPFTSRKNKTCLIPV